MSLSKASISWLTAEASQAPFSSRIEAAELDHRRRGRQADLHPVDSHFCGGSAIVCHFEWESATEFGNLMGIDQRGVAGFWALVAAGWSPSGTHQLRRGSGSLGRGQVAAVTTLVAGQRPSVGLLAATRAAGTRIAALVDAPARTMTIAAETPFNGRWVAGSGAAF
jgi:hypothetical protein